MKLACKDIDPQSKCDFESYGGSKTETAGKMLDHAKEMHAGNLAEMNMSNDDTMRMFEGKVRE